MIKEKNDVKYFLFIILMASIFLGSCCKKEECLTCPPQEEDTTSHVIQWQTPDTLGTMGLIRDVWVFDKNNAWAVGQIYLNDSTGKPNMENPYNAAHWDGNMWELKKIGFYTVCGQLSRTAYPAKSIYAFNATDIWITAGDEVTQYDGNVQKTTMCLPISFSINRLWGMSNSDLYVVGASGNIAHYNGSSWTKMASNTTVDLQDIWGIDANHIWATGTNVSDGHCVVLQYNGTSWTTIYDNANKPQNEVQAFSTVWGNTPDKIYLSGQSWIRSMNLNDGSFNVLDNFAKWVAMRIRGTKQNDIFQVDYGNEAMHFNGTSWYHYAELASLDEGTRLYSVHPTNDFVLLGGTIFTGLNGFPIVIRGYR